jgi:hypothetical protein
LQAKVDKLERGSKRKKVVVDPNLLFANIETIKQTMDEMAEREAIWQARQPELKAKRTAIAVQNMQIETMMIEWQL